MNRETSYRWLLLAVCLSWITNSGSVKAQISTDGTLPTQVNQSGNVFEITGGTQAGANLFHSFKDFSVPTGTSAFFNNSVNIQNIISRVTGTSISNIDGLIKNNGTANLFLLNPNGIIFGSNAKLNIGGSFLASTASGLKFADGTIFNTTDTSSSPLLTVSLPLGVQWGTNAPANISNAGNLEVTKDLTLSGGSVTSTGNLLAPQGKVAITSAIGDVEVRQLKAVTANLQAANNLNLIASDLQTDSDLQLLAGNKITVRDRLQQPFLAKAGGNLLLQGNQGIDIFALNHADSGFFSGKDMVLRSAATISGDAHYFASGSFRIENLDASLGNLSSPYDPIIRSSGDVSFNSYTGASLHIFAGGSVNIPGNITITGTETPANSISENVTLSDGKTVIPINGSTQKTLDIRAGTNAIGTPTDSSITIGSIVNNGGLVFLSNQYQPNISLPTGIIQVGTINTSNTNGNGGAVVIDSRNDITLNSNVKSSSTGNGKGADITLIAANGNISTQSIDSSGIQGGGHINLNAPNGSILISNASVDSSNKGIGKGGDINIIAQSLLLTNGGKISTNSFGNGDAGNIKINTTGSILIDGVNSSGKSSSIFSNTETGAIGNAGEIQINAGLITVSNGGIIATTTFGQGNAGGIKITTAGNLSVSGVGSGGTASKIVSESLNNAIGNAGGIEISAASVAIANGGQLSTNTDANGDAGKIKITASGSLSVDGVGNNTSSKIVSEALSKAIGDAGGIDITAGSINISNGGVISTSTLGQGDAGNLKITTSNSVNISGTGTNAVSSKIVSEVLNSAIGNAGGINITANNVAIANYGELSTSTYGQGNAGNIFVTSNTFAASGGGTLETTTGSKGQAGNIYIDVRDNLSLTGEGTGLFANTTATSTGNGGSIYISDPSLVEITDGAGITVNSLGGGNGGNISLQASTLTLNQSGFLSAATANGEGGSITLDISNLLVLRNNSFIAANAGGTANGGNVTITSPFVVAVDSENSDIIANALLGDGGNIEINATGIYGLTYRSSLTSNSDINASSQFGTNGTVEINTPGIDPAQGLTELPSAPIDVSRLVASACKGSNNANSQFIITGRGGLPKDPSQLLNSETILTDVDIANNNISFLPNPAQSNLEITNKSVAQPQLIEAQGWIVNKIGKVVLTSRASNITPHQPWSNTVTCNNR